MSEAKVQPEGYIQFLLASPVQFTCTEAARVQPVQPDAPAHDAFNRLLTGRPPDPEALWQEARPQVVLHEGVLVLDDSTLDKPYARQMGLVCWHWSGKHHGGVKGINLLTLLWTATSPATTAFTTRPTTATARTTGSARCCVKPTAEGLRHAAW